MAKGKAPKADDSPQAAAALAALGTPQASKDVVALIVGDVVDASRRGLLSRRARAELKVDAAAPRVQIARSGRRRFVRRGGGECGGCGGAGRGAICRSMRTRTVEGVVVEASAERSGEDVQRGSAQPVERGVEAGAAREERGGGARVPVVVGAVQWGPSALDLARGERRAGVAQSSDDARVAPPCRDVQRGDVPESESTVDVPAGRGPHERARGADLTRGASARGVRQRRLGVRRHPGGRLAFNRAGCGCSYRSEGALAGW